MLAPAFDSVAGSDGNAEIRLLRPCLPENTNEMTDEKTVKKLAKQLRNVGPSLATKLVAAGIDSPEKLRRLGAKKAFKKMYPAGDSHGDFNAAYLYALEGAIRDCDWLEIPERVKQDSKEFARALQLKKKQPANK